jgi:hypothetical protein
MFSFNQLKQFTSKEIASNEDAFWEAVSALHLNQVIELRAFGESRWHRDITFELDNIIIEKKSNLLTKLFKNASRETCEHLYPMFVAMPAENLKTMLVDMLFARVRKTL